MLRGGPSIAHVPQITALLPDLNAALRAMRLTVRPEAAERQDWLLVFVDGFGGGNASAAVALRLLINRPPAIAVPSELATGIDTPVPVPIALTDDSDAPVHVSVWASAGLLRLPGRPPVAFLPLPRAPVAALTALANATFEPAPGFEGLALVHVHVADEGVDGALWPAANASATVYVTVGHPPLTIARPDGLTTLSTPEDVPLPLSGLVLSDGLRPGARRYRLTASLSAAEPPGALTSATALRGPGGGLWQLGSLPELATFANAIVYVPAPHFHSPPVAVVRLELSEVGQSAGPAAVLELNVTVLPVADAPVFAATATTLHCALGGRVVLRLEVSDPDAVDDAAPVIVTVSAAAGDFPGSDACAGDASGGVTCTFQVPGELGRYRGGGGDLERAKFGTSNFGTAKMCQMLPWHFKVLSLLL